MHRIYITMKHIKLMWEYDTNYQNDISNNKSNDVYH